MGRGLACVARRLTQRLTLICLVWVLACKREGEDAAKRPLPEMPTLVVGANKPEPIRLRGTVQAGSRLRLSFGAAGVIGKVRVNEGSVVRKGQLLANLDITSAAQELRAAQVKLTKARREWTAVKNLAAQGALGSDARDNAENALNVAEAEATVARENLKRTQLMSPVAGKVVQRLANPGEIVDASTVVLVVDDTSSLVVRVSVTDRELPRIKEGQRAWLQLEDGLASAGENKPELIPGSVSSVISAPTASGGIYPVEIKAEGQALQLGGLVFVGIETGEEEPIRTIPLDAIVRRDGKTSVFVTEAAGEKVIVRLREIAVGRSLGREVVVRSGLKDGEQIISEGGYFLQDGQAIRVRPEGAR